MISIDSLVFQNFQNYQPVASDDTRPLHNSGNNPLPCFSSMLLIPSISFMVKRLLFSAIQNPVVDPENPIVRSLVDDKVGKKKEKLNEDHQVSN